MVKIPGRISKKFLNMTFAGSSVEFSSENIMHNIWFMYVQRVSKRLKTCDIIFYDGEKRIEFTTEQTNLEKILDVADCPVYIGGLDPLPWKKLMREAKKHKWQREDWQHMFEEPESESSDSDDDWKPPSESEEDSDFSDDEEPAAKRPCLHAEEQTCPDSKSE